MACRRFIPVPVVDSALAVLMAGMRPPEDWKARILTEVTATTLEDQVQQQRTVLERKRVQLKHFLIDGDLDQEAYRRERAGVGAENTRFALPPAWIWSAL